MGDVVHNLPVVTDIKARFPDATVDWVVEEAFKAIPAMHPSVAAVFPVAIRRWRRTLASAKTWAEIREFRRRVRATRYDVIIDTQGLVKSAIISSLAQGVRYGYDKTSARESLASLFYGNTFNIPWGIHAVQRNRQLAAQALGYDCSASIDYGIAVSPERFSWLPTQNYVVLFHGSSGRHKFWPFGNWVRLGAYLADQGIAAILPWGNRDERERSLQLGQQIPGAIIPLQLSLDEIAGLLAGAKGVIGVDTGLVHLAVALKRPVIGIYCATDPKATGLYGHDLIMNIGNIANPPDATTVIVATKKLFAI